MKKSDKKAAPVAVVPEIKMQAVEKAVDTLARMGASYKVLFGECSWGDLELAPKKGITRVVVNRGVRRYVRPFMALLREVSDVQVVPITDEFGVISIQNAMAAYGTELWGNGVITTHVRTDKTAVEVMLLEPLPVPGKRLNDDGEYVVTGKENDNG